MKIACAQILEILLLNLLSWSSLQQAEPKSSGQQTFLKWYQKKWTDKVYMAELWM